MRILCPIKRVPDPYAKPRPLPDGSGLDTTSLKFEINPFDEIALEAAVRLKETDPTIEIIAFRSVRRHAKINLGKRLRWAPTRQFSSRPTPSMTR